MRESTKYFLYSVGIVVPFFGGLFYKESKNKWRFCVENASLWFFVFASFWDPYWKIFAAIMVAYYLIDIGCELNRLVLIQKIELSKRFDVDGSIGEPGAPIFMLLPVIVIFAFYLPKSIMGFLICLFTIVIFEGLWWSMYDSAISYMKMIIEKEKR